MHPLLQKQDKLHREASALLQEVLLPTLQKYGTVTVGGSYSYKLLNYPDLDIDIVGEDVSKESFAHLCEELIRLPSTAKFKSADRVHFPHQNQSDRPFGFWLSPEINFGGHVWSVDVWFQKPEWHTGNTSRYEEELLNISDEKRTAILALKEELIAKKLYGVGKEFLSVNVYDGVLRGGVVTLEELRDFLNQG